MCVRCLHGMSLCCLLTCSRVCVRLNLRYIYDILDATNKPHSHKSITICNTILTTYHTISFIAIFHTFVNAVGIVVWLQYTQTQDTFTYRYNTHVCNQIQRYMGTIPINLECMYLRPCVCVPVRCCIH